MSTGKVETILSMRTKNENNHVYKKVYGYRPNPYTFLYDITM